MALEQAPNVTPSILKKYLKPTNGTAGSLQTYGPYEIVDFAIDKSKNPATELLSLLKEIGPDPKLARSIEQATTWRQKVKIPR